MIDLEKLDSAGRLGASVHWWRSDAELIFRAMLLATAGRVPSNDDLKLFAHLYSAGLELVGQREEHVVLALLYRFRGHPTLILPSKTARVREGETLPRGGPMVRPNGTSPRDGTRPAHVIHVTIVSPDKDSIQGFADTQLAIAGTPAITPRLAALGYREMLWGGREAFSVGWRLKLTRSR